MHRDQINGQVPPAVHLGDGTTRYLDAVKLTAMSESEDWVLGTQVRHLMAFRHPGSQTSAERKRILRLRQILTW